MARVLIEPNAFACDWFPEALKELESSRKVTFLFVNCKKGQAELARVAKALNFQKLMSAKKRVVFSSSEDVEAKIEYLENHPDFAGCSACDDPHILAAIFLKPTKYVFSTDARMAKCRNRLSGKVNKKFTAFVIIKDEAVYLDHRSHII